MRAQAKCRAVSRVYLDLVALVMLDQSRIYRTMIVVLVQIYKGALFQHPSKLIGGRTLHKTRRFEVTRRVKEQAALA